MLVDQGGLRYIGETDWITPSPFDPPIDSYIDPFETNGLDALTESEPEETSSAPVGALITIFSLAGVAVALIIRKSMLVAQTAQTVGGNIPKIGPGRSYVDDYFDSDIEPGREYIWDN